MKNTIFSTSTCSLIYYIFINKCIKYLLKLYVFYNKLPTNNYYVHDNSKSI